MNPSSPAPSPYEDDSIDFAELFGRLKRQLPLIVGLAALGLALGAVGHFTSGLFTDQTTSTRVVFSFTGFEKSEYPDKSKFQADDLRSPEIIAEAIKRKGFAANEAVQSKVRAGISVQGIIPDNIVKERDKLRASGQTPRLYVPDEYSLTLALPRSIALTPAQSESLLREIVTVYQEKFIRTYVTLPLSFGKAFEALGDSDYLDYEIVLAQENQNIGGFLTQMSEQAKAYRSPRTNLSFSDLLKQAQFLVRFVSMRPSD